MPSCLALPIGVILSILGSITGAAGGVFIRKAHILDANEEKQKCMYWYSGAFLFFCVNPILTVAALALAPATSAMAIRHGIQLLWTLSLSRRYLHETVTVVDYVGCFMIMIGILILVVAADRTPDVLTIKDFQEPKALCFLFVTGMFITSGTPFIVALLKYDEIRETALFRFLISAMAGVSAGLASVFSKVLVEFVAHDLFNNLNMKVVVRLVKDQNILFSAMATFFSGILQFIQYDICLKNFDLTYVMPVRKAAIISMGILGGWAIFDEVPIDVYAFVAGVVLMMTGVITLTVSNQVASNFELSATGILYSLSDHLLDQRSKDEALYLLSPRHGSSGSLEMRQHVLFTSTNTGPARRHSDEKP